MKNLNAIVVCIKMRDREEKIPTNREEKEEEDCCRQRGVREEKNE